MTLVLLHGLGCTREVWRGYPPAIAPDLPGHGTAAWDAPYTMTKHAEYVAALLPDEPVTLLAHSMGGMVALELAKLHPDRVVKVIGLGIKVTWAAHEREGAAMLAAREPTYFEEREPAVARFLKFSGLAGLVPDDGPVAASGVTEVDGRWRLAQDPATNGVEPLDMAAHLERVRCPVVLACGEHDNLVSHDELRALTSEAVVLPGLGHNAHVQDPAAVLALLN